MPQLAPFNWYFVVAQMIFALYLILPLVASLQDDGTIRHTQTTLINGLYHVSEVSAPRFLEAHELITLLHRLWQERDYGTWMKPPFDSDFALQQLRRSRYFDIFRGKSFQFEIPLAMDTKMQVVTTQSGQPLYDASQIDFVFYDTDAKGEKKGAEIVSEFMRILRRLDVLTAGLPKPCASKSTVELCTERLASQEP
jgi:hypothetical protein